MNKNLIAGALCAATILTASAKGSDPVLMTVGGKDVPLSEFEYLYNKNNAQQLQPQTIDEYVDMFVTYKLKVADAEAAGIDTTAAFINEFEGYRNELAEPYLADKAYTDSLRQAIYNRMLTNVDVSHIMVALTDRAGNPEPQIALIDSLRNLVEQGADFADLARRFSTDGSARTNGGHLGFIAANNYPVEFEDMAYATAEGAVSPAFTTRFGRHIIKRGAERPDPGQVHVRHILKMTRDLTPEATEAKKAAIDSIYALLAGGADFAAIATTESEDPGSARKGGELPWFGPGRMVPEFEQVAFSLADGETSEPFATAYGYHIINKLEHKGAPTYEEALPLINKVMDRDERKAVIKARNQERYNRMYPARRNEKAFAMVKSVLEKAGGLDSASRQALTSSDETLFTVDGHAFTVGNIARTLPEASIAGADRAMQQFELAARRSIDLNSYELARRNLAQSNTDYRNLIGEYRDGMLLYEISNRNVWDRAARDTTGLEAFFKANRDNYTWQKPHYKGYVVMTVNDSIGQLARRFLDGRHLTGDSLVNTLRKEFGKNVKVERVVTAQGANPIIDYVAFGAVKPMETRSRSHWTDWFAYEGRIIESPEEASDVKGAVSTDYQQELERQWVEQLHKKYPVKINKKVLKKVKQASAGK